MKAYWFGICLAAAAAISGFLTGCPAPEAASPAAAVKETPAAPAAGEVIGSPSLLVQIKEAEHKLAKAKRVDVHADYAEVLKVSPKDSSALFLDAWTKPSREEAETFFRESMERADDKSPYYTGLGSIFYEWKINDRAVQNLNKAIEINPGNYIAHYYKGLYHLRRDELDDAIGAFKKAIEIEPGFALAHTGLGRTLQKKKDVDKAIEAFQEAIKQDPKLFDPHYILGQLLGEKGKQEEAVAELAKAGELSPGNLEVQVNLARTFEKLEKLDEAIAAYGRAADIKQTEADIYVSMARIFKKQKNKDKEYETWEKAVRFDPRNADSHLAFAWIALERNQLDKADRAFQEAVRKKTDDHMIYVGLARIAVKREDYRKAMEHYRRALKIESASKEAKDELNEIRRKFEITTETYTAPTLEKVFAAFQQRILKAYKVLLRTYPKIKGKATIQVVIDSEGNVSEVSFEENTINHPALEACIFGNALMAKFPAGKKGKINYTMNFDPALAK
jgi:tetratricopeptide (TPR) repeat protein